LKASDTNSCFDLSHCLLVDADSRGSLVLYTACADILKDGERRGEKGRENRRREAKVEYDREKERAITSAQPL
jgi:hypothetical protein